MWRCGNQDDDRRPNDCGCGGDCPRVAGLTPEEFEVVAATFIRRLSDRIASAGCNDLFTDEFPQSVCDRFRYDGAVLRAFEHALGYKS